MHELLLPAGNFEKLKAAVLYGADAVYLAGKRFGMRSAADNFTTEELIEAAAYCHQRGKKMYITVNISPRWYDYDGLAEYFDTLRAVRPDALIVADPGVLTLAKEMIPEIPLHLSTQAGAVSHADCTFWQKQGVSRVVLARELPLKDIKAIKERISPELELEAFIHGAMCVSFSGRCLLSNYLTGRDANRGMCAQPCRWEYKMYEIEEVKRPGMRFPVEETPQGSFILSSKDMCMIEHIPQLMESGVTSFKVEGRMKSAYYAAVTANAYRMAMDAYLRDPQGYRYDPAWLAELESVSHREYCTGYWFHEPLLDAQTVTQPGYLTEKGYLAVVDSYDAESGRAVLIQKNKFASGDTVEYLTPGAVGKAVTVTDLRDAEGNPIPSCPHPQMRFTASLPFPVKAGDILRSAEK